MVPFKGGEWVFIVTAGQVGFIGKQRNTQENWVFLESPWRIGALTSTGVSGVLKGKKLGNPVGHSVWLETSGAEVYMLGDKPDWIG